MTTSSASSIHSTMTGNSTARQKTVVPPEGGSYTRPILNNGGGFVVYPTYLPSIINQPLPGVLNHSQNFSNAAANPPAFHIAHGPGAAPTAMFIPHHLPNHALASVPVASEQFMSPGSLAFTHMATMSPAMYLDGTYSGLIPSALSIPSQNPMRSTAAAEEEALDPNGKVSTSNASTIHSASASEWKSTFVDSVRVSHPSGQLPLDSYPSTVHPHILMPGPYPFFHASRIHQQQSSYPFSSDAFALRKDRPVVGPNSTGWLQQQESVPYSLGSYPPGSGGGTLPTQSATTNVIGTVVQVPHPLATSAIVQPNNVPFSEANSMTTHSQRFVIPGNVRLTDPAISAPTSVASSSLSYAPLRRHTNSSGFEEPEILTAKNDAEDTHYMSEEEEVIEASHGTVVATGNSRAVRNENTPPVNKTVDASEVLTHLVAPEEQKKAVQSHLVPMLLEEEYGSNVPEEGLENCMEHIDVFQSMYPEEKLRHLTEEKISELRNHHRAIMDLLNSKEVSEGRSPQEFMPPVVSFTMLPSSSLYRSHIVPDNYLHTANRPPKSQISPGEKTVVANVINDSSLVAVPSLSSGAMPNFLTSDNTHSPSALVPGVSGANSRAHFFYPSNGLPQAQPHLLYLYDSSLYSNAEVISTETLNNLNISAQSMSAEYQSTVSNPMEREDYVGVRSGDEHRIATSVVENSSNLIDQRVPPSSFAPLTPTVNPVTATADESVTGIQRKVGRFQVQVIPITEKDLTAPVSSAGYEPLKSEPTVVNCVTTTNTQPVSSPSDEMGVSGASHSKIVGVASTVSGTTHVSRFRRARIEECLEAWEQNGNSIRDWRSKNPESNVVKMVKKSSPLNEMDVSSNCPLCSFQNDKLDTLWQCNHKADFNPHFNMDLLPKAEMWLHGERHAIQTNILNNYGLRHHPLVENDAASYLESVPMQTVDDVSSTQKSISSLIIQPILPTNNRCVLRPTESASLVSVQGVIMSTGITSNLSNYHHFRTHGHTSHTHNCHPVKDMSPVHNNSQTTPATIVSSSDHVTNEMKSHLQNALGQCHSEHYHSASTSPPHNASEVGKGQEFSFPCTQLGDATYNDGHQQLKKSSAQPCNGQFCPDETPEVHSVSNCVSQPSQAKPPPGSPRLKNQISDLPPQELVNCVRPDPEGILTNPTLERFHMKRKEEQKLQDHDVTDYNSQQRYPQEGSSGNVHQTEKGNAPLFETNTEAALQRLEERIAESLDEMRETLMNRFRSEIEYTHNQIKYLMEQNLSRQRHWKSVILCLQRFVPPEIFDSLWQLCAGGPEPSSPSTWNMSYPSFFVGTGGGPSGQQSVPEENIYPVLTVPQYVAAPSQTNVIAPSFNPNQIPGGSNMPQFRHYFSTAMACDKASAIPVPLMQTIPVTASHPFNGVPRVSHC